MKYTFLIIYFLFHFCVFSQNKKVTYNVHVNNYSDVSVKKARDNFKNATFATDYVTFDFIYNSNEMYFTSKKATTLSDEEYENLLIICDMEGSYYKNNKSDFLYRAIPQKRYLKDVVCTSKLITNWKYSDETKVILGYKCKRAECELEIDYGDEQSIKKYSIVAWYCPDIKASYGLKGYGGLSGLILELNQNLVTFIANKIEDYAESIPFKIDDAKVVFPEKDLVDYIEKHNN